MQFNKSVATINTILKILDIMSLRSIFFKNKFGFIIGTLNPNMSFFLLHVSAPKWTEVDQNGSRWSKWTEVDTNGPNGTKMDRMDRLKPKWT